MDPLIVNVNNNSRNETSDASDASELPDCSSVDMNVEQLAENIQHLSKNSDCKQSKTSNITAESKMNLNPNTYIVHNNTYSSLNKSTTLATSTTSKLNGRLESEILSTDLTCSNENGTTYRNVTFTIRNGITGTLRQQISESSRKVSSVSHTKKFIDSNSHKRKSNLVLDDHAIKTYRDHYSNIVPSIQYPISLVDRQRLYLIDHFEKLQLPLPRIQEVCDFFGQIHKFSEPLSLSESPRRLPLFLPKELALLLSQIPSIHQITSRQLLLKHHPLQDSQLRQQKLGQELNDQEQQHQARQQLQVRHPQQQHLKQELRKPQLHEGHTQQQIQPTLHEHQPQQRQIQKNLVEHELQGRQAQPQFWQELEKGQVSERQPQKLKLRQKLQISQPQQQQLQQKIQEYPPRQQYKQQQLGNQQLLELQDLQQLRQQWEKHQTQQDLRQLAERQVQQHIQPLWGEHALRQQPLREHQTRQQQFVKNPLQQQQIIQYHTQQQQFLEYYTQQHLYQKRQAQEQQEVERRQLQTESNGLQQYQLQYKCHDQLLIEQQKRTQQLCQQELQELFQQQSHQQLQPQHLQTTLMIEQDALTHGYATIEKSEVCIGEQSAPLNLVNHKIGNVRTSIQSKTVKRRSVPFKMGASKILRMNSESTVPLANYNYDASSYQMNCDSRMLPVSPQVTKTATNTTSTTTAPSMASLPICPLTTKTSCQTRTSHQRKLAKPIKISLPKQAEALEQPFHNNFSISNVTNNSDLSQEQFVEAFRSSIPQLSIIPLPFTESWPREVPALPEITITSLHPKKPSQSKPTSKCNEDSSQLSKSTDSFTKSRNYNVLLSESSRTDNLSKPIKNIEHFINNNFLTEVINNNEIFSKTSKNDNIPTKTNGNEIVSESLENIASAKMNDNVMVTEISKNNNLSEIITEIEILLKTSMHANISAVSIQNNISSSNMDNNEVSIDSLNDSILSERLSNNHIFSKVLNNEKINNNEIVFRNTKENTVSSKIIPTKEISSQTLMNQEVSSEKIGANVIISEIIKNKEISSQTSKNEAISSGLSSSAVRNNISYENLNNNVIVSETTKDNNVSEKINNKEFSETSNNDEINGEASCKQISFKFLQNNDICSETINENKIVAESAKQNVSSEISNNNGLFIKPNVNDNTVTLPENVEITSEPFNIHESVSKVQQNKKNISETLLSSEIITEKRININSSMDESSLENTILKNDIPKKKDCEVNEKGVKNANISPQLIDRGTETIISNSCEIMKEYIENPILTNNLTSNGASENAAETRTGSNRNKTVSVYKKTYIKYLRRTTQHSRTCHVCYPSRGRHLRCMQTIILDVKEKVFLNRFNQRRRNKKPKFWFRDNCLVNFRKSKRAPIEKLSTNISIVKEDSKDSQSTPEENRNAPDIIEIIDDSDNEKDPDVTLVSSTIYIDLCDDDSNESDKDILIQSNREVGKNSNRNNNVQSTNIRERSTFNLRTGTNMNEPKVRRPMQLIDHNPNVDINSNSRNNNISIAEYNRIAKCYYILNKNKKGPTLNEEEYVDEVNLVKSIPNSDLYVHYYTCVTQKQMAHNSLPISFGVFLQFYRDGKLTMFDKE